MSIGGSMLRWGAVIGLLIALTSCSPPMVPAPGSRSGQLPAVLAAESFLADIAQNVAGDRLQVMSLIPIGVDPHGFQPTPADVKKVADSQVLIVNGAGFEEFLDELLQNAGGERIVIEAAAGLQPRQRSEAEDVHEADRGEAHAYEVDPHFWLDPLAVITYVENMRDGLSRADPAGREAYTRNANAYIGRLRELDQWIVEQVAQIPESRRKLITNHESFGYFADRYGFEVIGAIIPSVSTGASPSARELTALIERMKEAGVSVIFLETGSSPQLARQIAQESGVKVVTGLYTHSLTDASGLAPTYIDMMKYNVKAIVEALK